MLLLFEGTIVGEIVDPFEHQGTWFGTFRCMLAADGDEMSLRVRAFIEFCQDWYVRSEGDYVADASEFDRFRDVVTSGKWRIQNEGGSCSQVADAPVFADGLHGQISWVLNH
jgi:hypothetical protein